MLFASLGNRSDINIIPNANDFLLFARLIARKKQYGSVEVWTYGRN
jgi:hypothetical protein